MSARKVGEFKWQMMELPDGITTSDGNWYHITSEQIEKYTPGLLKRYTLERIIKEADAWVKSADGLSLLVFFLLTYLSVAPWLAALLSIVFFVIWFFNTGAFLSVAASPVVKLITTDGFVYMVSAVLLMGIAFNEVIASYGVSVQFNALWFGLILFFLFKVGLLRLLIRFVQSKRGKSNIEIQDRILNMLLIRYGMKSGILTGNVSEMENRLIEIVNYHKTRKK